MSNANQIEPEMLSGGHLLMRALKEEGVEYIYGYPGGAVLHIYDAIHHQSDIKHILVRHEQAATHMADAYARATGKAGCVLLTSGPGATNGITGIATAYTDSIPMVVITGQEMSWLIGDDAFQETDMLGISRPVVKHSMTCRNPAEIPTLIKKAFHIAQTGRPGPVLVDIPKDMTAPNEKVAYTVPEKIRMRSYNPVQRGHSGQIKKAIAELSQAKRPVIFAGGGVILGRAAEELTELAHRLNYPVTNSLMGLGGFPGTDQQYIGMLGMHGSYEANLAMHQSDCILAIGVRFDDRQTNAAKKFCPDAKIIQIDIDPSSISKNIEVDIPIVGPVKSVLKEMLEMVRNQPLDHQKDDLKIWWKELEGWRQRRGGIYRSDDSDMLKPQFVIEKLWEVTKGDAFICSDVGQHQMFAAQYYKFNKPNRWINSGGLGTMGFGLPAAMGVQLNFPDADVVCVTGEGSIQMNIQELSTCKQYKLPVKILCLNNGYLGMVKQWQDLNYESRYSNSYMDSLPDFVKLAESYGHVGFRIEKPEDLEPALKEMLTIRDRAVFMDVLVEPKEHVYPMQVPNGAMCDMLLSKTERT